MEIHCQEENDSMDHRRAKASGETSQTSHRTLLLPHEPTQKQRQGNMCGHSLFCLGLCKRGHLKTPCMSVFLHTAYISKREWEYCTAVRTGPLGQHEPEKEWGQSVAAEAIWLHICEKAQL